MPRAPHSRLGRFLLLPQLPWRPDALRLVRKEAEKRWSADGGRGAEPRGSLTAHPRPGALRGLLCVTRSAGAPGQAHVQKHSKVTGSHSTARTAAWGEGEGEGEGGPGRLWGVRGWNERWALPAPGVLHTGGRPGCCRGAAGHPRQPPQDRPSPNPLTTAKIDLPTTRPAPPPTAHRRASAGARRGEAGEPPPRHEKSRRIALPKSTEKDKPRKQREEERGGREVARG